MTKTEVGIVAVLGGLVALAAACGKDSAAPGNTAVNTPAVCLDSNIFTVLPIPTSAIASVAPVGGFNPPVHSVPTDHGGFYVNGTGVTFSAPIKMRVTSMSRVQYLTSPFRQGQADYTIISNLCRGVRMRFNHVQGLGSKLSGAQFTQACEQYSTADETVQKCEATNLDITLDAGETIGAVGGTSAGAFDMGVHDTSRYGTFANASRWPQEYRSAQCPYEAFTPALRQEVFSRIKAGQDAASGEEPVCGTMSVDVVGAAQGIWVTQSNPVNLQGDESPFLTLAPHPAYPVSGQTISAGPSSLRPTGYGIAKYPVVTTARVNRRFKDITADGLIYCYNYGPEASYSYFVRLASGNVLSLEAKSHAAGSSPCADDPATWTLSSSAVAFIR